MTGAFRAPSSNRWSVLVCGRFEGRAQSYSFAGRFFAAAHRYAPKKRRCFPPVPRLPGGDGLLQLRRCIAELYPHARLCEPREAGVDF